jgi:CBS domain-containing protein
MFLARAARGGRSGLLVGPSAVIRCRCLSSTSTTKLLTAKDILKAVKESELKYITEVDKVAVAAEMMIKGGVGRCARGAAIAYLAARGRARLPPPRPHGRPPSPVATTIGSLIVKDAQDRVVGFLTQRDVLRTMVGRSSIPFGADEPRGWNVEVGSVMTKAKDLVYLAPEDSLEEARALVSVSGKRCGAPPARGRVLAIASTHAHTRATAPHSASTLHCCSRPHGPARPDPAPCAAQARAGAVGRDAPRRDFTKGHRPLPVPGVPRGDAVGQDQARHGVR